MSNETYWDSIQIIKDPKKKEIAASFVQTDEGAAAGSESPCVRILAPDDYFPYKDNSGHYYIAYIYEPLPVDIVGTVTHTTGGTCEPNSILVPQEMAATSTFTIPRGSTEVRVDLQLGTVLVDVTQTPDYKAAYTATLTSVTNGKVCGEPQCIKFFAGTSVIPPDPDPDPEPDPETEIPPNDDQLPECDPHDCDALTEAAFIEANRKIPFFINVPSVTEFNQLINFEETPLNYFATTSFIPWTVAGPIATEGPCTLTNVNRPNGVNFIIREGTQANPKTGASRIIEQNSGAGFGPTAVRSNIGTTSITGQLRFWYYPYTADPNTLTNGVASASMYNGAYRIWADGGLRQTFDDLGVYVDAQNGKIGIIDGPSMTYDPTKWWLPITFSWSSSITIVTEENSGQYPGFPEGPVDIISSTAQGTLSYDGRVLYVSLGDSGIGTFVASAGFEEADGTDDFASLLTIPTGALLLGFVRDPEDEDSISRHFRAYTPPDHCERIP